MKQWGRRAIGLLLAAIMLFSMVPAVFADVTVKYADFPTGWSKAAMTAAVNNGLLNGYEDGNIYPEANLTRAQFAAIITRAFGAETKVDISGYTDVSAKAWYYDAVAKAVKMGALKGQSATQMAPDAPITRQEVFTAVARVLVLASTDTSALNKFNDKGSVASWAQAEMAALTARGYVNGDPQGNANPTALITREEFAQFMHNAIRTYITVPGTYSADMEGITVIRVGGVTVKGLTNTSDLVVGDGAMDGDIRIEDVTIGQRLLARGGTIKVVKSTSGEPVVVNNVNGITNFKNYRDESFFKGIVENTTAKFLTRYTPPTGGGTTPSTPPDTIYTITLKVDGADYETVVVTNSTPDKTVADPTKAYYTFNGWFDGTNTEVTDFSTVTGSMELNAKFTANTYTVSFAGDPAFTWADGYSPITSFTVEECGTKALPAVNYVVAPAGYTFLGWTVDGQDVDSLQDIYDNGDIPATAGNIAINAKYAIKNYTIEYTGVTFVNGYTAPTTYTINNAASIVLPTVDKIVVPTGKEFRYWKNAATGGRVDSLSVTDTTPDTLRLTPHFVDVGTPDEIFNITLQLDGSTYFTVVVTNGVPNLTGYSVPTKNYYTFDGWYDGATKVTDFSTVNANKTLVGKFNANVYTVTFAKDATSADFTWATSYTPVADFTVENMEDASKALPVAANMVFPVGYEFVKFVVDGVEVDSLKDIYDNGDVPTTQGAVTIYVVSALKTYFVSYENVTFVSGYTAPGEYTVENASTIVLPTADKVVAPAGKEFKYWKNADTGFRVDSLSVTAETPNTLRLEPYFADISAPDEIYTVTLMDGTTVHDTVVVTNGVPNKTVTNPTKEYNAFTGWYTDGGVKVEDLGTVTSDITLYARYDLIRYTLEYDFSAGGSWEPGFTPSATTFTVNSAGNLPTEVVPPAGKEFVSWQYGIYAFSAYESMVASLKTANALPKYETATITLTPYFTDIPVEPVTVKFFNRYTTLPAAGLISTLTIDKGTTVDAASFPSTTTGRWGYVENDTIASVYEEEYKHEVAGSFWYLKDGEFVPFDETVVVNEDMRVYLLTKQLSLQLNYDFAATGTTFGVFAEYNNETRVMDTLKDMLAVSGRNQLEMALANNQIPKYEETVDKVIEKLVAAGVLELDGDKKNIQVIDVPIKISLLVKEATIHQMVKLFVRDAVKDPVRFAELYSHVDVRGNAGDLDIDHIVPHLTDDQIIAHINGLGPAEKQEFADKLFEVIKKDVNYKYFVDSMMNKDTFEINKANASEIAIIDQAIRKLTLEEALAESNNSLLDKLVDVVDLDNIRPYYEAMRDNYCDELEVVISNVLASADANVKDSYTTALTYELNIFDVYEKLYDKAADKVINKLENAGVYYNENKYLKFLAAEQDFLEYLFDGDKTLATDEFTGYSLKGVMDYYDYLVMLLLVGDDALTWYGDETEGLTEAQFNALYDAAFDKIFTVHEKVNKILVTFKEEGKLPAKVQNAIESIDKLNSLFLKFGDKAKAVIEKYLGSSINGKFEDESIANSSKVQRLVDLLVGKEDPVVSIDTIYAAIYQYDETVQEKLQQVIESDKFKAAVDKFEATSFGELFDGKGKLGTIGDKLDELKNNGRIESALDSVYDLFYILAYEGLEAFAADPATMKVTDIDKYIVKVGKIEMIVQRNYR